MADSGTYDQATILRRQKIAEQMLANAQPPQNMRSPLQGLAYLANTGADAFALNRLDKQAAQSREADRTALMGLLGGNAPAPAAAPSVSPMPSPRGASDASPAPDAANAIAGIESGGKYDAMGPVTKTGDRAYGKYQVMGANIPDWTKEHLGQSMTPEQFLADPQAQDAVFKGQFGKYVQQTGNPQDAASMWFTGKPLAQGAGLKDQLGTSGQDYADKFSAAMPPSGPSNMVAGPGAPSGLPPVASAPSPGAPASGPAAVAAAMSPQMAQAATAAPPSGPAPNQPPAVPDAQRAAVARVLATATPGSPAYNIASQIAAQMAQPHNFTYQTLPDGTVLRMDPTGRTPPSPVYQAPVKPSFGVIGKDRYGNDIHGFIDPSKQSVNPVSAVPNAPPGQGAANPDVTGEAFLSTLPKPQADQIKGITEGRIAPPGAFALKTPYWQKMLTDVAQYEPGFDLTKWGARAATAKDFASGKSAQNITSFNTAIGHLDTLDKSAANLGNTNFPIFNTVKNMVANATGDPQVKEFDVAKNAVTDELTRAFRGTGGNVHDLVQWENAINNAGSPAQLRAAIRQATELLRSRIESVGETYNRGMNTKTEAVKLLSPKAQEAIDRLSGGQTSTERKTETAPAPTAPQSGNKTSSGVTWSIE